MEGLMLKLKLQYFGHLMRRADSFEKTLMLEKIEGRRRRGRQRMRWLDGITDSRWIWVCALEKEMATHSSVLAWRIPGTGEPGGLPSLGSHRVGHPTISSSVIPFSSCLQSFPASGSFPMSQLFTSGGQSIGASASASVLPMNIQD